MKGCSGAADTRHCAHHGNTQGARVPAGKSPQHQARGPLSILTQSVHREGTAVCQRHSQMAVRDYLCPHICFIKQAMRQALSHLTSCGLRDLREVGVAFALWLTGLALCHFPPGHQLPQIAREKPALSSPTLPGAFVVTIQPSLCSQSSPDTCRAQQHPVWH